MHLNAFDGFSWAQVLQPVRQTRIAGSKHYRVISVVAYICACVDASRMVFWDRS